MSAPSEPVTFAGALAQPATGPGAEGVELRIARDLVRRGLLAAPLVILVAGLLRGPEGAFSAGAALLIVFGDFLLSAATLNWAARISGAALVGAALGGFVIRLAIITAAGVGLKQLEFFDFATFGIVLVVCFVGLLFWELRYVSISLAAPGVKPAATRASTKSSTKEEG